MFLNKKFSLILLISFISSFIFTSCTSKSLVQTFKDITKEYNINYKTMLAICKHESGHNPYVINVNKSFLDIQRGSHYFDSWITANLYMDLVLDPLLLNYDIGICQVNKQHLNRFKVDNEDLLDIETNIEIATKIYAWNVKECNGNIRCALSMYNTGYKNSKIGRAYAEKVIKIRNSL